MVIDLNNPERRLDAQMGQALENDIFELLIQGKLLLAENPKSALELFYRANSLYRGHSPDFRIECMIDDLFYEFVDRKLIPEV